MDKEEIEEEIEQAILTAKRIAERHFEDNETLRSITYEAILGALLERGSVQPPRVPTISLPPAERRLLEKAGTFEEFASELDPKNLQERFLAICYWIKEKEGKTSGHKEIEPYCTRAGWPAFSNVAEAARRAMKADWIARDPKQPKGRGFYPITKGILHVKEMISRRAAQEKKQD